MHMLHMYLAISPRQHIPLEHHFTADEQWSQQTMRQPKLATPSVLLESEGPFLVIHVEDNRFNHGLKMTDCSISAIYFEIIIFFKDNAV